MSLFQPNDAVELTRRTEKRLNRLERHANPGGQISGLTNRGLENLVINGDFRINQRSYVSGATLTPGLFSGYGHDRWRTAARMNRVRNPRASVNTTDWTGLGTTLVRQTSGGPFASAPTYVRATVTTTGATKGIYMPEGATPAVAGALYRFSVWVRCSIATTIRIDASGYSGASPVTNAFADTVVAANTWTRVAVDYTAGPGVNGLRLHVFTGVSVAAGTTIDASAWMVTESSNPAYIDGDITGYAWLGTAGASMSIDRAVQTSYTFIQAPNGCTITVNSGGAIQQVIERANLPAGDYTLSWAGTARGRVFTRAGLVSLASLGDSGLTFTTDGTDDVVVEFEAVGGTATLGMVSLVAGAVAYPFHSRQIGEELALCQRYFIRMVASSNGTPVGVGIQQTTTQGYIILTRPPMRTGPSLAAVVSLAATDVTAWEYPVNAARIPYPGSGSDHATPLIVTWGTASGATVRPLIIYGGIGGGYLDLTSEF